MKKFILLIILCSFSIIASAEKITNTCYKYEGVYVCKENEIIIPQKIETPKEETKEIIVKTFWTKSEEYSAQEICNAIYIIEGKEQARQPYGIETIECGSKRECEQICLNTVNNNRRRYAEYGHKEYNTYLKFLASRYCPVNQENWLRMLKFYLEKE